MSDRAGRYRIGLTAAGSGIFTLVIPGLGIAWLTGSRLLVALGIGAAAVLVVDLCWSAMALRPLTVQLTTPPSATIGDPVGVTVRLATARAPLECSVSLDGGAWAPALAPTSGRVEITPEKRGERTDLPVAVATSVPFGLIRVRHSIEVALERPLAVVPPPAPLTPSVRTALGEDDPGGGVTVGLRPYVDGDQQRDVHWPSVARTGTMLVRERRQPRTTSGPSAVTVSIADRDPEGFEDAVAAARSVVESFLAAGRPVRLLTVEPDASGPEPTAPTAAVDAMVGSIGELHHRLARARSADGPWAAGIVISGTGVSCPDGS